MLEDGIRILIEKKGYLDSQIVTYLSYVNWAIIVFFILPAIDAVSIFSRRFTKKRKDTSFCSILMSECGIVANKIWAKLLTGGICSSIFYDL